MDKTTGNITMNAPKETILYTGAFRFPDKDAASHRVLGIANALRDSGFNIVFCGWEQSPRPEDLQQNGVFQYEGFEYYFQCELELTFKNQFQRLVGYVQKGTKTIRWIKNYIKNNKVHYIIVYNSQSLFILKLFLLSKKYK